jgi:hypothetical protein
MKKFFILALFVGLFVSANSVWAQNDNKKSKTPAKVEATVKKADTPKAAACCAESKEGCSAKAGGTGACCAEKKTDTKAAASCCTNKEATKETKSSGKKAN